MKLTCVRCGKIIYESTGDLPGETKIGYCTNCYKENFKKGFESGKTYTINKAMEILKKEEYL